MVFEGWLAEPSWEARLRPPGYGAAAFVLRFAQAKAGGAEGSRTPDPHNAIVVLYQLSYDPIRKVS